MKRILFLSILTLFIQNFLIAQPSIPQSLECGTDQYHDFKMSTDPVYKTNHEAIESKVYSRMSAIRKGEVNELSKSNPLRPCLEGTPANYVTLPVVIFIMNASNSQDPLSDPTDQEVIEGIELMNNMFRSFGANELDSILASTNPLLPNPDSLLRKGVDTEIQFSLAKRDKVGNPTTGIYRIESNDYAVIESYAEGGQMQESINAQIGPELFPGSDYIQLFYVDDIEEIDGINPAGYASLGGILYGGNGGNIVIDKQVLTGRTQTHELGHYFGLRHTFQSGCGNSDCLLDGDRVCDTPPDDVAGGSSCVNSISSCDTDLDSGPFTVDQLDPARNFMDYSGGCGTRFSQGQKDRMWSYLLQNETILKSKGCIAPDMMEAGIKEINYPNNLVCNTTFAPIIEIENNGNAVINSIKTQTTIDGGIPDILVQSVNLGVDNSQQVTLNEVTVNDFGSHTILIEILEVNAALVDTFERNNYYCHQFEFKAPISSLPFCENGEDGNIEDNFYLVPQRHDFNNRTFEIGNDNSCGATTDGQLIQFISRNGETYKENTLIANFDLSDYSTAEFSFDLSYLQTYTNRLTTLDISVSENCGLSFNSLYNKTHSELSTADSQLGVDIFYVPGTCDDWRNETINLDEYAGCQDLILKMTISIDGTWGQNLYLDNICLDGVACNPMTNTSVSPDIIIDCDEDSTIELTVGNLNEVVQDFDIGVVGWWITKEASAADLVNNKSEFETALANVDIQTLLDSDANVVYEGDNLTGAFSLAVNCQNLEEDASYFATPFISGKFPEIPDVICENIQGQGSHTSVNSGSADGSIVTANFNNCVGNFVNPAEFTLTVNITNFVETLPANIALRLRNGSNDTQYGESITIESLPATFVFTQDDFPAGYDPVEQGLRVFLINYNSEYAGSGNPTMSFNFDMDILYPGAEEITFPSAYYYNNCVIGTPISFTCNCETSLPLELVNFYGKKIGEEVELSWTTESEQNTDYFEVEHSINGVTFQTIGKVQAHNNSNINTYKVIHPNPERGSNYYRLNQFDLDGKNKTYDPIEIFYEKESSIIVYPVPTKVGETLNIDFNTMTSVELTCRLIDVNGKIVFDQTIQATEGMNNWSLPTSKLQPGVYFFEVQQHLEKTIQKVILY